MTSHSALQVRSLAEFLAAVPYVLGFHPADSIVVVALRGTRVAFAARHDLPPPSTSPEEAREQAAHTAGIVVRQGVERTVVIGYGEPARVTPAVLRAAEALRRRGLPVIEELRVTGGRYWSYGCKTLACCPADGTPCVPEETAVAARATYHGQVALPDRAAFLAQLAPVDAGQRNAMADAAARAETRLADLLRETPTRRGIPPARQVARAAVRDAERVYRSGRRLTDEAAAWLGVLLVDVAVRDYAWERCAGEHWEIGLWTDLVRRLPPRYVPAPAALLAFAAWTQGQGALAAAAVGRALQADPLYSMARLIGQALDEGVSPAVLVESGPAGRPWRVPRRRDRRGTRRRAQGRAVS